jgi:hypothetical protein
MTNAIEPAAERPAIRHARDAATAMGALRDLGPRALAASPSGIYDLIEHLLPTIYAVTITCTHLADLLHDWANLSESHRGHAEQVTRLRAAASQIGMHGGAGAARLYQYLDDAQCILDRPRYRAAHGIPQDYPGGSR